MTAVIRIADLNIGLEEPIGTWLEKYYRPYLAPEGCQVDFSVRVTMDELYAEQAASGERFMPSLQWSCMHRHICERLPEYDAFMLHAAVVAVDGHAYAFSAKSGTGKSTHLMLWRKLLGDRMTVINGDKPILRYLDGRLYVYGTPWAGKENLQTNTRAELSGLCFLERGSENRIEPLAPEAAALRVMHQVYRQKDPKMLSKQLDMIDDMLHRVPLWLLHCDISDQAAALSYQTMHGAAD